MCLYPKLIQNKKYLPNKKNGGNAPPVKDQRTLLVPVGCGKCMECMKQRARGWQVRMQEDIRTNKNGKFVTLTFSPEALKKLGDEIKGCDGYERENKICKLAVRRFCERWRKKHKKSIRHWLTTELGGGRYEHIHMHGILWTDNVDDISTIWQYGYTWIGKYVTEKTINYITKYVTKTDAVHSTYTPLILTSAGIGKNYINRIDAQKNKFNETETKETYRTRQGTEINLPIYYRNQIYTEEEKEKLWLQKLDKNERWICGEKIPADDEEQIYKLQEYYRQKNKRLGYGDNSYNWEQKSYERELRNLKYLQKVEQIKKKNEKNEKTNKR